MVIFTAVYFVEVKNEHKLNATHLIFFLEKLGYCLYERIFGQLSVTVTLMADCVSLD